MHIGPAYPGTPVLVARCVGAWFLKQWQWHPRQAQLGVQKEFPIRIIKRKEFPMSHEAGRAQAHSPQQKQSSEVNETGRRR